MTNDLNGLKDPSTRATIRELSRIQGMSGRAIATLLNLAPRTVQAYLSGSTWFGEGLRNGPRIVISSVHGNDDNNALCELSRHSDNLIPALYKSRQEKPNKPLKIAVIADTQCKPTEDLSYMSWIGKFLADKTSDVIVHIGDHYDFPSLSSYDKGKKSFEGRRLQQDIEAGNRGMQLLMNELNRVDNWHPRLVFCMGNHEERLDRLANDMPELDGFVGTAKLPLKDMGWEVIPFLKPIEIGGIFFVHYLANEFTGKPYTGTAANQLKTVGRSFVAGHKQCLDFCCRSTIDGRQQLGIIAGACYPFDESYKGYQGNHHWRGLTILHEVEDGFGSPMFVKLDYMRKRYACSIKC